MSKFTYKGVNNSGAKVDGTIEATDRQHATKLLRGQGIRPISISGGAVAGKRRGKEGVTESGGFSFLKKPIAEPFLAKLLQLHKSGMPIGDAIKLMQERISDPRQQALASQIWQDLSEGLTLAKSMQRFPEIFDASVVYSIEAGEASGSIAPILENVVAHLREQAALKKNIYSALAYPIFITFVAFSVVGLFLFYLLPRIQSMMQTLGGKMTLSARILIGSADVALWLIPIMVVGGIVGFIMIKNWRKKPEGRLATDGWLLRIPFVKNIFLKAALSESSNLMATLLDSGVNTTDAMKLTERLITNEVLRARFQNSQRQINDGMAISKAFKTNDFYPDLAIDILSVGENTGNMVHSFREIYKIFSEELEANLRLLTNVISSVALMFAFLLVSVLALSIVTSVLQISSNLTTK